MARKTLAQLNPSLTLRGKIEDSIARTKDKLTFGAFQLLAGRQPSDEEYFGVRTRFQLLRKAL